MPPKAPHHLPSHVLVEITTIVLFLAATLHAVCRSAPSHKHKTILLLSLMSSLSYHIFYYSAPSYAPGSPLQPVTWSAESLISNSRSIPRTHEILLMTTSIYSGFITANVAAQKYPMLNSLTTVSVLTSLSSFLLTAVHDILAPTFLWRTWHTHHPSTLNKLCGVPVSFISRMLLFVTFVRILYTTMSSKNKSVSAVSEEEKKEKRDEEEKKKKNQFKPHHIAGAALALTSTVQWMLQLITLDLLKPSYRTLLGAFLLLVLLACSGRKLLDRSGLSLNNEEEEEKLISLPLRPGIKKSVQRRSAVRESNAAFAGVLLFYLVGMACLGLFGNPSNHISFGHHQKWGGRCHREEGTTACRREELDANWKLCNETFQEYPIASVDYRARTVGWYGICGRTREENAASLYGVVIVSLLGSLWYGGALVFCSVKKTTATKKVV